MIDKEQEQLSLPIVNTCAPPATRGECGEIARPCNRYTCRHHLWTETERQGRPHGGVAPAPKLKPQEQSCALDIADANPDGLGRKSVARVLGKGVTVERVRQIEARALRKLAIASQVVEWVEIAAQKLPSHARLVVAFPKSLDTGTVAVQVIVEVDRPEYK